MKRRWFLAGLALSAIGAGCTKAQDSSAEGTEATSPDSVSHGRNTLVVATSANYPPYEYLKADGEADREADSSSGNEGESSEQDSVDKDSVDKGSVDKGLVEEGSASDAEANHRLIGFDIDLAGLIAKRLDRKLKIVDLAFEELIPALVNNEADIAIAALEPSGIRQQSVDFSNVYYRSRQALISVEGYLGASELNYQTIGIRKGSVQARYTQSLSAEHPDLNVVTYDSIDEALKALDTGEVEGIVLEANVAQGYLPQHPDFEAQMMPSDQPNGSAIALPKDSPLRSDINAALSAIQASGEMDQLIKKWFS